MDKLSFYMKYGRAVILILLCFFLWLLLSREVHFLSLLAGLLFSVLAALYSYSVFFEKEHFYRSDLLIRVEFVIIYVFFLIIQSYLASFELIYRMISGRYNPGIVRIRIRLRSSIGKAFLANTISMIPGTLSIWLNSSHIFVHWFDKKSDHNIEAGRIIKQDFERILQRIFG
ncbi:MAG: Na+/H+ antiporter subunit E [Candidatus Cloacimonetes bacterium]|nr:Na+/H+ antiporter subunit E [Candidatus Cloacimonadota bacterium]